jgi:hypothetical protein
MLAYFRRMERELSRRLGFEIQRKQHPPRKKYRIQ